MNIESYSEKYLLDVIDIVKQFHAEAFCEYDGFVNVETLIQNIKNYDPATASSFLLIIDGRCQGILYGQRFNSLISNRHVFQEIIWYVNKSFRMWGVSLLREAEKSLKSIGVNTMIMAVLENSKTQKIKRFYDRLGYKPMEVHYVKDL